MLTSLLSLYIASALSAEVETASNQILQNPALIATASVDLKKLISENPIPIKNPTQIAPIVEAKGSIAIDLKTGATLYDKNAHTRLPIASITKLMTVYTVLDEIPKEELENKLKEATTISANAANKEGSQMFLRTGEQITLGNLLKGILIHSANDAATAVAEHHSGSVQDFVTLMNQKALKLGLINTHYANPTGLDHPDNYSSAYDTAKLSQKIYNNAFIQEVAQIKNLDVTSISGNYTHKLKSTNQLLDSYLKIKGLKTGKTDGAGLCLASVAENDQGNEIITIVLNSPARFQETKNLIDWIFRSYNWQN